MKRSFVAAAALIAAGTVSAQSSVTLFGVVDATLAWGRGSLANRFQLTNSGYNSSRLGFRGTEDLGGGLSASFWLEAGVNNDNGTGGATNINNQASGGAAAPAGTQGLTFNRRSTVSLAGNWGELRLGRDYTPQFWNWSVFDPFGVVGVGADLVGIAQSARPTGARASNSIGYFLPAKLAGVYGQVMYYAGENLSNAGPTHADGSGGGIRVGYEAGPFNIAAATSYTRYAAGGVHQTNFGAQWKFPWLRLMGMYDTGNDGPIEEKGWLIGAVAPVGPGEIRASYARFTRELPGVPHPHSAKLALGYVYNLSKRTAVYTTYAHLTNANGASLALNNAVTAPNSSSNGLDIGVRVAF